MIENEVLVADYEKNNQKFLTSGGVEIYFGNVFIPSNDGKLPMIKNKLRHILVDFGLCQTCMEINQELNFIKVWYLDSQATELKGKLLQRYNRNKESQAIELVISLEGSLPSKEGKIKTYTGLTKLLFQEFIEEPKVKSLVDDNPYNQMKELIKQGNLAASQPLQAIFRGELG